MAPLMGDDIHLRQRAARRPEPRGEFVVEGGVQVDGLVVGAVEGTDSAGRTAAAGVRGIREQHDVRRRVTVDLTRPIGVQRVGRTGHAAVDAVIRGGTRGALGERRSLLLRRRLPGTREPGEVHPEHLRQHEQTDEQEATTTTDRDARVAPAATDVAGVDVGVVVERHATKLRQLRASQSTPAAVSAGQGRLPP